MHSKKFRVALMLALAIVVAVGHLRRPRNGRPHRYRVAGRHRAAGVTVEVKSASLQARARGDAADGHFLVLAASPGDYTMTATLSGSKPSRRRRPLA